ncbi:hypothetical protein PR048_030519 [Dryococelus australis]|uniref:Uncharacterized protein n=1 Tax=Dryococelus australis TaxID=614101 RepID=A0ABQ9GC18_9NEOP|nr:hypothetical protein PR048_030519 [Dryococelus australis]
MQWRGKRKKIRRPAAHENPGVTPPGIEPDSPRRKAISLTTTPSRPLCVCLLVRIVITNCAATWCLDRHSITVASELWESINSAIVRHAFPFSSVKLNSISAYAHQKAKSLYINRIRLQRASEKQSSDTYQTPYDRVKRCRGRKINIKASERANVDIPRWRVRVSAGDLGAPNGIKLYPSCVITCTRGSPAHQQPLDLDDSHMGEFRSARHGDGTTSNTRDAAGFHRGGHYGQWRIR